VKPRIVKLRSGFLATTVPGSECLNRDGQPIGVEFDEYAAMPTAEEAEKPLAELFSHVPQEPWSVDDVPMHVPGTWDLVDGVHVWRRGGGA